MQTQELTPGQKFKLPGQRKFRTIAKIFELKGDHIPAHHQNKLLFCIEHCRQIILSKETEVIIPEV